MTMLRLPRLVSMMMLLPILVPQHQVLGSASSSSPCVRTVKTHSYAHGDYPANKPIEDRHSVVQDGDIMHAAVFDGHGGYEVAELARSTLVSRVQAEVSSLKDDAKDEDVADALTKAYLDVEQSWIDYVHKIESRKAKSKKMTIGACGLYALVRQSKLFVANAGDCRAVLGRRKVIEQSEGEGEKETSCEYDVIPLSYDHNSRELREVERLSEDHPDENDIVMCYHQKACYVKGRLQPSRAIGDLHLKLAEYGPPKGSSIKWTPPYLTALPEITGTTLGPQDSFLVMGSDGLWDELTNEEVVDIIGNSLEKGTTDQIAQVLIDTALGRVAAELETDLETVKQIPQGNPRRNRHDDITVVVLFFKEAEEGGGEGCEEREWVGREPVIIDDGRNTRDEVKVEL